jgi:hypothetical protein
MTDTVIALTDEPPEIDADLELLIDYREEGSAARAFEIAAALIRALEPDRVYRRRFSSYSAARVTVFRLS